MHRQQVQSSNLAAVGYHQDNQTLEIEFLSGRVYQYFAVPAEVYAALMEADSHGTYSNRYIKPVYRYQQVS